MEAIVDFVDGFINDTLMPIPSVKTKSTTAHRTITRSPEELAQMKKACESGAMPVGAYWYDGDCHWCKKGDKRMADGSCLGAGGHYMGGPRKRDLGVCKQNGSPHFMGMFRHHNTTPTYGMVPSHVPHQKTPESCAKEGKVLTYGMRDGKVDDVVCVTPEICAAHGGEWAFDGKVATCNVVTKKKEKEVPTIAIGLGALLLVGVAVVAIMGVRK